MHPQTLFQRFHSDGPLAIVRHAYSLHQELQNTRKCFSIHNTGIITLYCPLLHIQMWFTEQQFMLILPADDFYVLYTSCLHGLAGSRLLFIHLRPENMLFCSQQSHGLSVLGMPKSYFHISIWLKSKNGNVGILVWSADYFYVLYPLVCMSQEASQRSAGLAK